MLLRLRMPAGTGFPGAGLYELTGLRALRFDEAVAEIARRLTSSPRSSGAAPVRVVDVGTGTGAIAVAAVAALRRRQASCSKVQP